VEEIQGWERIAATQRQQHKFLADTLDAGDEKPKFLGIPRNSIPFYYFGMEFSRIPDLTLSTRFDSF
jgi:hypothetical protein